MKVHHLNCGSMCPVARRILKIPCMVCHCLLIETPSSGLVLVDTGIGLRDVREPSRLGPFIPRIGGPRLDPEETAFRRVEKLGFKASDVRHIVVTHLDLDHAGGIPDFPDALVHVHEVEHRSAFHPEGMDRIRYRQVQFVGHPHWSTYSPSAGERWYGFDSVRGLKGLPPEILMIPLPGHSHGHSAVAVQAGKGWLLHCGDSYYSHGEVHAGRRECPPGLELFERLVQADSGVRLGSQDRLRALATAHGHEVRIFCAHDESEFQSVSAHSGR